MHSKLSGTGCAGRESELWVRGVPTPLPSGKLLGGNSEQKEPQCLMCNPPEMYNPPWGAAKAAGTEAVAQQLPPELCKPRSRDNNELMCATSAKLQLISALSLTALPAIQISS